MVRFIGENEVCVICGGIYICYCEVLNKSIFDSIRMISY